MKKVKIHRPGECTCRNCCQSEADLRYARGNRKKRLRGQERRPKPNVKYKSRRFYKECGWLRSFMRRMALRVRRTGPELKPSQLVRMPLWKKLWRERNEPQEELPS